MKRYFKQCAWTLANENRTGKRLKALMLVLCCLPLMGRAAPIDVKVRDVTCRVAFYAPGVVRVTKFPTVQPPVGKSLAVIAPPDETIKVETRQSGNAVSQTSSGLRVTIDKRDGSVTFFRHGKKLLAEAAFSLKPATREADRGKWRTTQAFKLDKDEPIYGLGTLQNGLMDRRNTHVRVEQTNLEDFQNVIQSIKGYGVFFDNYALSHFDADNTSMTMTSEVAEAIDYYFIDGGSVDGVVAGIRRLTGHVPMMPLWSFGFMQSKERYKSAKEVLEVANRYRTLGVPLDCMIQDWQYWGSNYTWNAMDFLAEDYANARQMIDSLHHMGAKLMISIWSSFGPKTKAYADYEKRNMLFSFQTWPQSALSFWPPRMDYPSGVRLYKPYSREATDIYWSYLKKLHEAGCDGWWMDSTDPDQMNVTEDNYDEPTAMGTYRSVRNAFPLCSVGGVYENQRRVDSTKRVFIMTRSAFAGQQRYASNMWSGDVGSSWEVFRKQIPLGLSFTMTGNPNFNTDIGGFFCGAYNVGGPACHNPQFQELFIRWMQYALFCPVFRSHGTDCPREIYQFGEKGEPVYDAIEQTIRLRYRLLPYLYSTAWQVTHNHQSFMRPLVADFANDKNTWLKGDMFMCGASVLAAPITHPQYTKEKIIKTDAMSGWDRSANTNMVDTRMTAPFDESRTAHFYLPKGTDWYYYWTEERYKGGNNIEVITRLDETPMFVRAGTILPLADVVQHTTIACWDKLELKVFPGSNGHFTLYEDEGDSYQYEKGAYSTIDVSWDEQEHLLTIGPRCGHFKGMTPTKTFVVTLVGKQLKKEVTYNGQEMVVKL